MLEHELGLVAVCELATRTEVLVTTGAHWTSTLMGCQLLLVWHADVLLPHARPFDNTCPGIRRFKAHKALLAAKENRRVVRQYNKLATTLVKYEALYHGAWLKRIEHSRSALHSALIVHHPRTGAPGTAPHVPRFSCQGQWLLHLTGAGAARKSPVSMGSGGSVHMACTCIGIGRLAA